MIGGMKIVVNRYLCKVEFVRWRKSHRKSRINKKWHKKYGAIWRCKGMCFNLQGHTLVMCPCTHAEMMKVVKDHPDPFEAILTAPMPPSLAMFTV